VAELQKFLLKEVQMVYRLQGVDINDKHFEIIIRQMLRKRRVVDPGDSRFLINEEVDIEELKEEIRRIQEEGGKIPKVEPVLVGISKAALSSSSWISAASFQETTKVLTDAACEGRVDELRGIKENVIIGNLIPPVKGTNPKTGEEEERKPLDDEHFCGYVFKVMSDPYAGQLTYFRVFSGKVFAGSYVYNATKDKKERIGRLLLMHANSREDVQEAAAGEIVAAVGLDATTGDTICDEKAPIVLENLDLSLRVLFQLLRVRIDLFHRSVL